MPVVTRIVCSALLYEKSELEKLLKMEKENFDPHREIKEDKVRSQVLEYIGGIPSEIF